MIYYNMHAGAKFWRQSRRKVFAISASDLKGKGTKRKKHADTLLSESESEEEEPDRKRKRHSGDGGPDREIRVLRGIAEIKSDVSNSFEEVKETLQHMLKFNAAMRVPLWLYRLIGDTFMCTICRSIPIKPPVIMTKCCKSILGCEACVNSWYSGEEALTKTCPCCRAERGYSETMLLRGLDSFLVEAAKIMQSGQSIDQNPPVPE